MSKVWTVVIVDNKNNVSVQEHWTHIGDTTPAYKSVSDEVGPHSRVIAMIPGSHMSGSKVFPFQGVGRKRESRIDPFDTPMSPPEE